MKKLLLLSGNSIGNREWGDSCAEYFRPDFDLIFYPQYAHWTTGEKDINFEIELQKVKETVVGAGEKDEWFIFARSIGSILGLRSIQEGSIAPKKCVFFGMPLKIFKAKKVISDWSCLTEFAVPTLAFHNTEDAVADYSFTVKTVHELAPSIVLQTLPGKTHEYLDFALYASHIKKFLSL